MRTRSVAIAALLLVAFAIRAQEPTPPLAVRKDALRPGWFFVGVVPGVGTEVPILIELRSGTESAPVRRYRSPQPRSFDLCALLRSAGIADQAGPIYLLVSRGPASFRFSVPYNGRLCVEQAAPSSSEVAPSASSGPGLAPLVLTLPPPPVVSETGTPAIAQAAPVTTRPAGAPPVSDRPAPPGTSASAPAAASRPVSPGASPPAPSPAPTRVAATQPVVPMEAAGASQQPEAVADTSGLSAAERGLTKENFEGLSAFLLTDKKLGTQDVRFVLRFKRPVNIEGVEDVAFLKARVVKAKPSDFLPAGIVNPVDLPDDPQNTLAISTTVSMGIALEVPGVNHVVSVEVQVGIDPALASFAGRVGVKKGLEK